MYTDTNNIVNWCDIWSMTLNFIKCTVIYFGKNNPKRNYQIMDGDELICLEKTESERDLGVIISSSGKTSEQLWVAVSRATGILGLMRKTFRLFDK